MKKIPVDAIEDDTTLARDVSGPSGNILLSAGIKLNKSLAKRLKNWGIGMVYIEGEEESQSEESSSGISPDALKTHLEHKFSDVISSPLMQEIFTEVYAFRLQNNLK